MTEQHKLVAQVRILATADRVWRELIKTDEPQAAVFNAWLYAQAMLPGAIIQMRTIDGRNVLVVGRIVEFDPPRRFSHTFRFTQYDDPECTVVDDIATVGNEVDVTLTLTREAPTGWGGYSRRIDREILDTVGWPPSEMPHAFVCGPTKLVESVGMLLVELGHDPARVRTERFGPTG